MGLRVGVIGLGVGHQHLLGYLQNQVCEVVALCDHSREKLEHARELATGARTTQSADEILSAPDIDLISIASYDEDHYAQVVAALSNGKNVFVEKPLCQSLSQLTRIKEAWQKTGQQLKIKSNLVLRAAPLYAWARDQIASGRFGEVYSIDGDYLYGRLPKILNGWRAKTEHYSVMEGGGVHLIDLILWLTRQRPRTIHTVGNKICTRGSEFRYEDYAAATMTFNSGLLARVSANFGCVHGHQHVVRVFGTEGTLLYDDQGPRFQSHRDPAPSARPLSESPLPASKHVLIDNFVNAILDDTDLQAETQLDFDVMSVCIASDKSLKTGTTVEIEYV